MQRSRPANGAIFWPLVLVVVVVDIVTKAIAPERRPSAETSTKSGRFSWLRSTACEKPVSRSETRRGSAPIAWGPITSRTDGARSKIASASDCATQPMTPTICSGRSELRT